MANTKNQQLAIDLEGTNIIVSAGAGSGKTAVLTQRVIRKINDGIPVDRLLVLTFTNEAANEMKNRIRSAIIKNNLTEQLGLLDSSYITTFDSFALSVVKKYHYLLNIKKDISITDKNIISIYKNKIITDIFERKYGEASFNSMINAYCLKDDKIIKDFILEISSKLDLLVDKKTYLSNYIETYYSDNHIKELLNEYTKIIKNKIEELRDTYKDLLSFINDSTTNKLDKYLSPLFTGNKYDEFVLFNTMPTVKITLTEETGKDIKDEFKNKVDEIKKLLHEKSEIDLINSIISTKEHAKVIIDIIKELDKFVEEYKDTYGIYEFNDIAHMAIDIVANYPSARDELKDYFNEIMVDEYQDTSSIQEEFISHISNNNVYMVGDIKQSIYRFRNANPYIFQEKYDSYSHNLGGIKIDLLENFRSRKETLFNINEIFNLIMDNDIGNADYIKTHNMIYGNKLYDEEDTKNNNSLEIYNYSLEDEEFTNVEKELFIISEDITKKIKEQYPVFDKEEKKLRPIKYSDICIITDRNTHLTNYRKILEYNKIPSVIYMDEELTSDTVIMVIKNLIDFVNHVKNNILDDKFRYLFTSIARSFLFNYSDDLIYRINKEKTFSKDNIYKIATTIDTSLSLVSVINEIIEKYDVYLSLTNLSDIDKDITRISNLIDIASSLNDMGYTIEEFINYLEEVNKLGLSVKYKTDTGSADSVKIMNIHKSKGLEFSLCYFTGMTNKFTIKEISSKFIFDSNYGIILPYLKDNELTDTITKDIYKYHYLLEEVSEKIRLFYVALTRCREKMIIVAPLDDTTAGYNNLVPFNKRLKYRSFLDILKSINLINKYIVNKTAHYTKDYLLSKIKKIEEQKKQPSVIEKLVNIEYKKLKTAHFSKEKISLLDKDTIKKMKYGTDTHELFEYTDFSNTNNKVVKKLLKNIDLNYQEIYKEYEFIYTKEDTTYHGIIDLLLVYPNHISIIDYKLKNIDDEAYLKQLSGYLEYIKSITNKEVSIYLYSILDEELRKIG